MLVYTTNLGIDVGTLILIPPFGQKVFNRIISTNIFASIFGKFLILSHQFKFLKFENHSVQL